MSAYVWFDSMKIKEMQNFPTIESRISFASTAALHAAGAAYPIAGSALLLCGGDVSSR